MEITAIIISALALIISLVSLIFNFIHHKEKRHGEIIKIKSDYMIRLNQSVQKNQQSMANMEMSRILLRDFPDSDTKFECIESIPGIIETSRRTFAETVRIKDSIGNIDPDSVNESKAFMRLQAVETELIKVELSVAEVFEQSLSIINSLSKSKG